MFSFHRALAAAPRRLPLRGKAVAPLTHRYYVTEAASPEAATQTSPDTPPATTTTTITAQKPKYTSRSATKPTSRSAPKDPNRWTAPKPVTVQAAQATPPTSTPPATTSNTSSTSSDPGTTDAEFEASGAPAANADIDWSSSFHGVSTQPVSRAQYNVLMGPTSVKDIEVKPDGIIYLPEIKYRRKLNEAFGPMGWGLVPRGDPVVGNNIVTREYALVVGGRFVSQSQGENGYFSADQLPSSVEGCKSNALMRCCKDLGIASELWDPHFLRWFRKNHMEEAWGEHAVTKKKRALWFRKGEVNMVYPYKPSK